VSAILEVKDRENDPGVLARRSAQLQSGEIHLHSTDIAQTPAISRKVREGVNQPNASANHYSRDNKICGFVGPGINAHAECEQFTATLYGTENILVRGENSHRTCYFFHESEFFRHRAILDGAVAAYVSGTSLSVWLCVNPLSPRYATFLNSPIVQAFPKTSVRDPAMEASEGVALTLEGDHDRRDTSRSIAILFEKFGKPVMTFPLTQLSVSIAC